MPSTANLLDNPTVQVTRSVFRDRNGDWAKVWEDVAEVYVEFSDGTIVLLTPAQFRSLTREQQDKVRWAPSSPLP